MGKVFVFHIKGEKRKEIKALAEELGHEFKFIPRLDYERGVGELMGIESAPKGKLMYEGPDFEHELMLFGDMSAEELEAFLDTYKEKGIVPVARKAMTTPTNINWSVLKLYEEMEDNVQGKMK